MLDWARDQNVEQTVLNTLLKAADRRPNDLHHQPSRRGNRRPAPWQSGHGHSMVVDTGGWIQHGPLWRGAAVFHPALPWCRSRRYHAPGTGISGGWKTSW